MKIGRRELLLNSSFALLSLGFGGCLSIDANVDSDVHIDYTGNVSSDEPLLQDADLSIDSTYPHHYAGIVGSETEAKKIRIEYIRREIPIFLDNIEETDFSAEYLVFFGMVLPPRGQLEVGPITLDDGTLQVEYSIEHRSSASQDLQINTAVVRVEDTNVPDDADYRVEF